MTVGLVVGIGAGVLVVALWIAAAPPPVRAVAPATPIAKGLLVPFDLAGVELAV